MVHNVYHYSNTICVTLIITAGYIFILKMNHFTSQVKLFKCKVQNNSMKFTMTKKRNVGWDIRSRIGFEIDLAVSFNHVVI